MRKAVLLLKKENERTKYFDKVISNNFECEKLFSSLKCLEYLKDHFDDLSILVLDAPQEIENVNDILSYIKERNNYMFSLPVLVLTDPNHFDKISSFFTAPIVEIISSGDPVEVTLNRIENSIRLANSTSFDEFSEMLKVLPSLVYLKDKQGRYAFCSQNWHHLSNQNESIRGKTDFDIRKDKNNARIARESDLEIINTGHGKSYVIKEVDEQGTDYLQIIKEPVRDSNGNVSGIIAIINNVTNEELLRQQLREKSITDQLTGLYNRAYFEELTNWQAKDLGFPLTIISADCDDLKQINDKFGHSSGDQYICYARDALAESLPQVSYLFRMGGDEFLAIVPHTDKVQANELINKIHENIKHYKNDKFALKLSVGSFTINKDFGSIENAVNLSDEEMYKDKKQHKLQKQNNKQ